MFLTIDAGQGEAIVVGSLRAIDVATTAAVTEWQVRSSVEVADGEVVSRPEYRDDGWLLAPPRSTVLAALLANGQFPDVMFSTNMRDQIDVTPFGFPWWYRATFDVGAGGHTLLRIDGVIHKAQLWVNGTLVADVDQLAGAYPVSTFDVTNLVNAGSNCLALLVFPGHPMTDLSIGWVDWNPAPPDTNMGVWRDVSVIRTGEIRLLDPVVRSTVAPTLDHAVLRIGVDVENLSDDVCTADIEGVAVGSHLDVTVSQTVVLGAGECKHVEFDINVHDPALWWPTGHGDHVVHWLRMNAVVDGVVSDVATTSFGIREITSRIVNGGRLFSVNGRPIQVLGGGWCPDIFLRHDAQRLRDELTYAVEMGLNTIRLEGKLENPEFFDIADELGLMVLPGWECCDKWEAHAGTGGSVWTEEDFRIARRSMASEARLLRNHPSVIGFQIGSDFAPPARLAEIYVDELKDAKWNLPIVSSGATEWNNAWASGPSDVGTSGTHAAGPSGMKMWPYDWVPPIYWYGRQFGAAAGFDSECSAGHSVPRLPSLRKMLTPEELDRLWQHPEQQQYHAAPPSPFDNLGIFATALANRYGSITSLRDFLRKSQLANYEMVRAQFEAYRSRFGGDEPATGVIYWMLNTAWPSLNWHLYDYFLDPAGAYFGAKKANRPLHVLYDYATGEVVVVNSSRKPSGQLRVEILVRDVRGDVVAEQTSSAATVDGGAASIVGLVEPPPDVTTTYFVELRMMTADDVGLCRNVYWLSTVADVVDWEKTFWQHTPQAGYADFTALQELPAPTLEISTETVAVGANATTTVILRNVSPNGTPVVGVHVSIVSPPSGEPLTPIRWDDNDVTLFAAQSVVLTARHATVQPGAAIEVDAFNLPQPAMMPIALR